MLTPILNGKDMNNQFKKYSKSKEVQTKMTGYHFTLTRFRKTCRAGQS
jgi:hypothetical protein